EEDAFGAATSVTPRTSAHACKGLSARAARVVRISATRPSSWKTRGPITPATGRNDPTRGPERGRLTPGAVGHRCTPLALAGRSNASDRNAKAGGILAALMPNVLQP